MTALSLDRVTRNFGNIRALDAVSLDVAEGEILCLLGPSGCGKSTLLRAAAGLESIDSGRIHIRGRVVVSSVPKEPPVFLPPEERETGFVFQDFALFPHLDSLENVAFGLRHLPPAERRQRARDALGRVGMEESAHAFPHTLSGGQQQRVALARAMAPAPKLFLLDEPFSGLDRRLRHKLAEETWRILKDSGAASVVVTHDPEEAMFLGDRVAVMRAGRIEQIGAPAEIYAEPASAFVADFFGDTNRFRGTVGDGGVVVTPLGPLKRSGLAGGLQVDVLVRHEGVQVRFDGEGTRAARVVHARPLGGEVLVFLALPKPDGGESHVYARLPGNDVPKEGTPASVSIDQSQAFVFPSATAK